MKIMFLDIETSPNVVFSWRTGFKLSIMPDNIIEERKIICACWKWADQKTVYSAHWGREKQDDKELLIKLSKEIKKADVVIAHNGDRFDLKWINGRLLLNNLPPIGKVNSEDTLTMSRRAFNLNSHKLDYLGEVLGVGRKLDTGFSLWKNIILNKSQKALTKMVDYCKQDVVLLENVYNKLSPHVVHKVNKAILKGNSRYLACKACGSTNVQKNGTRITSVGRYQRYQCQKCAHNFQDTRMIKVD